MWCIEAKAKIDIPLGEGTITEGETITVTKGCNEEFALWSNFAIYDLPKEYVGETIRIISE